MIKDCEYCGNEYSVKAYRYKISRFCSTKCRSKVLMGCYKFWQGKKRSSSTVKKMSSSHKKLWEGNERIDSEGYVFVRDDNHPFKNYRGYVRKHRKIIEDFIGMIIPKEYDIHHVDKNKENNRISNLMVFSSRSAHRRFELGKSKVYKKEIIFDGRNHKD